MAAFLEHWKPYLKTDDYDYLTTFIENIYQNIVNQKIVILVGSGCNGKTTLINQIVEKIGGEDICCRTLHDITENPNRKIVVLDDYEDIDDEQAEFLLFLRVVLNKENIVMTAISIEGIPKTLRPYAKIILMEHLFT
jgi:tRNA A37 threonylcarbamoyladenosine biosynthesis protein TsaE